MAVQQAIAKPTVTIYVKPGIINRQEVFIYNFAKNPELFKWLLASKHIRYHRPLKCLYSIPDESIFDFLELQSGGRLRINKFAFRKEALTAGAAAAPVSCINISKYEHRCACTSTPVVGNDLCHPDLHYLYICDR